MADQGESNPVGKTLAQAKYDATVRGLQFELEQFWKRSLFFWGFIGAALVALSAADKHFALQGVIASFGFVCSMVWTLGNRGSKYWFEVWQRKHEKAETLVTGVLYGDLCPKTPEETNLEKETNLKKWLQGRRYSPSKLTIALSDYVVLLWFGLLVSRFVKILPAFRPNHFSEDCLAWLTCSFMLSSIAYAVLLVVVCHVKPGKATPNRSPDTIRQAYRC